VNLAGSFLPHSKGGLACSNNLDLEIQLLGMVGWLDNRGPSQMVSDDV